MRIANKEHRDLVIRYLVGRGCNREKLLTYTYRSLSEIYTDATEHPFGVPSTTKGKVGTLMTQARKMELLRSKGVKQIDLNNMSAEAISASYLRHGGKPGTLKMPKGIKRPGRKKQVVVIESPESILAQAESILPVAIPVQGMGVMPMVINDAPSILEVLLTALVDTKITVYTTHLGTCADTNWSRTKSDKYIDRQVVVTIHDIRKSDKYFYVCFKESGFDFEMMLY